MSQQIAVWEKYFPFITIFQCLSAQVNLKWKGVSKAKQQQNNLQRVSEHYS